MAAHLGAAKHERTEGRTGYRHGTKPRPLVTWVGTIELAVPQDRDGIFPTEVFVRYQGSERALVSTLLEMYLQRVSTRKVATLTEQLYGTAFSRTGSRSQPLPGGWMLSGAHGGVGRWSMPIAI